MRKIAYAGFAVSVLAVLPLISHAAATDNISGFAWSDGIGWVSMNCWNDFNADNVIDDNRCTGIDPTTGRAYINYGVNAVNIPGSKAELQGYAWSESVGWISFNPQGPYPPSNNVGLVPGHPVQLDKATGKVTGWARSCAVFQSGCSGSLRDNLERGGWDGWVGFGDSAQAGSAYGGVVVTSSGNCVYQGWGWGGWDEASKSDPIGWLKMNPSRGVGVRGSGDACLPGTGTNLPVVNLTANPLTVNSGSASTLSWTVTNATSCTASDGWFGSKNITGGSETTGPLSATTKYTLTCSNTNGQTPSSVTVTVGTGTAPTVTLSASPTSISSGGSSTLSWTVSNASSCTASGGWTGAKNAVAGTHTQSTGPLTATTGFTITCTNATGSAQAQASATVTVLGAPTVTLSANPTSIASGGSSTLSWTVSNASSCTASDGWTGTKSAVAGTHTQSTGPLSATTGFTITCVNATGSAQAEASATVTVQGNRPPIAVARISLDGTTYADQITVNLGETVNIHLSSAGSSDPDGWTNASFGISQGGKCEWNGDLVQGSFVAQDNFTVTNPSGSHTGTATSCDANVQALQKTFNDLGAHTYEVLRITDAAGAASVAGVASSQVRVNVIEPFDFSLGEISDVLMPQNATETRDVTVSTVSGSPASVTLSVSGGNPTTFSFLNQSGVISNSCLPTCTRTLRIRTSASTPPDDYVVTVRGRSGTTERTRTFTLTVSAPPPLAPAAGSIIIVTNQCRVNRVSWGLSSGATDYKIYRCDGFCTPTLTDQIGPLEGVSAPPYVDGTISYGARYGYGVSACNAFGCSSITPATPGIQNVSPVVDFHYAPLSIIVNQAVIFTGDDLNGVTPATLWSWVFRQGSGTVATRSATTSPETTVTFTEVSPPAYEAILTARNGTDSCTVSKTFSAKSGTSPDWEEEPPE
ncbi:MAG: hypothetical protein Q7R73_00150 [bacterium]|nr:hypothetical protein [bacterium]